MQPEPPLSLATIPYAAIARDWRLVGWCLPGLACACLAAWVVSPIVVGGGWYESNDGG